MNYGLNTEIRLITGHQAKWKFAFSGREEALPKVGSTVGLQHNKHRTYSRGRDSAPQSSPTTFQNVGLCSEGSQGAQGSCPSG